MIYSSKFCGLGHLKTKENTQIIVDSLLYQIIRQSINIFPNIEIDFTITNMIINPDNRQHANFQSDKKYWKIVLFSVLYQGFHKGLLINNNIKLPNIRYIRITKRFRNLAFLAMFFNKIKFIYTSSQWIQFGHSCLSDI